jgi:hypothetical protein
MSETESYSAVTVLNGYASVKSFTSLLYLTSYVKGLLAETSDNDVQVFLFYGQPIRLTRGARKFMVIPGQDPIPLFEPDVPGEIDESGSISGSSIDSNYQKLNAKLLEEEAPPSPPPAPEGEDTV